MEFLGLSGSLRLVPLALLALFALCAAGPAHAGEGDWRGFYVGGNVGYGFGTVGNGLSIADGLGTSCHFCDNTVGGGPTIDHLITENAGSPTLKPHGFSGGLRLGYNWQATHWVYGLEAEAGAFAQRGTDDTSFVLPGNTGLIAGGGVCGATGPETCIGNFSTKLTTDWLLMLRPRLGYSFGSTLVYGSAGVAITRLKFEQTYTDNITYPLVGGSTGAGGSVHSSASAWRSGWVIGAGFERALQQNWSLKAEYLYMRFAGISAAGHLTDGFGGFADFSNGTGHLSSSLVRAGLNYKFGG